MLTEVVLSRSYRICWKEGKSDVAVQTQPYPGRHGRSGIGGGQAAAGTRRVGMLPGVLHAVLVFVLVLWVMLRRRLFPVLLFGLLVRRLPARIMLWPLLLALRRVLHQQLVQHDLLRLLVGFGVRGHRPGL